MLDPQDRHLLLDALRPLEGYQLDFAIGTTYTLDLLALLTAPVGFTIFELAGAPSADWSATDTVRLLSVLRTYAERIAIFCQAGRIAVPPKHRLLFGLLERSVVEVRPPDGKSFHPKLWVLRFTCENEPVRYRVLCMSRNLTFDRSWDTLLVLDGVVKERKLGFSANRPLADFVAALPPMAKAPSPAVVGFAAKASEELRRVEFELPEPFQEYGFWPFGLDGYGRSPFDGAERTLIVSPFLSGSTLEKAASVSDEAILISRTDALDLIPRKVLKHYDQVFAFNPDITTEQPLSDENALPGHLANAGLHAKLYVMEEGKRARILTGSANATSAGFHGNVEFMTELVSLKSRCGIDVLMATEKGKVSLKDILVEYPLDSPPLTADEALEAELQLLDEVRCRLSAADWEAEITPLEDAGYRVVLRTGDLDDLPSGVHVETWPVLLPMTSARALNAGEHLSATFENLSFEGLSAFFALDVRLEDMPQHEPCQFVVNARLIGEPEGRRERITQYLLRDREQVVRFLLSLLASQGDDLGDSLEIGDATQAEHQGRHARGDSAALLEPLLRALEREPGRLDEVATVIEDLKKTEEGRAKLPVGLDGVWDAIWKVRQSLRQETR